MLRPRNRAVEKLSHGYLRFCFSFTAVLFGSGPTAPGAHGFERVAATTLFAGTIGFHRAAEPG